MGEDDYTMRIHGQWYDVAHFDHPGGPIALSLGYRRDATALFEGHHPFSSRKKLAAVLDKYRVEDDRAATLHTLDARDEDLMSPDGAYRAPFEWSRDFHQTESPFAAELKERVSAYFVAEAKKRGISPDDARKATPRRWAEMIILTVLAFASIPFFVQGYWLSLVLTPTLLWMAAVNTLHDGSHFSISRRWQWNAAWTYLWPWTMTPLMWYHQHVIGHHAYPNVAHRDPDLAHAPAVMRLHESIRWKPAHRLQVLTTFLVWTMGSTLYMTVVPLKALFLGSINRSVAYRVSRRRAALHVLGRAVAVMAVYVWPWLCFSWPKALLWCTLPWFLHSLMFMASTQLNHLTSENVRQSSTDYYKHQVETAHDFSSRSYLTYLFTGGLNLQIEHHLFPCVNHCHLLALQPIVRAVCLKHGVFYHESGSWMEALDKFFTNVRQMAIQPQVSSARSLHRSADRSKAM